MSLVIIKSEESKRIIRKYFPNFDFAIPLKSDEWNALRLLIKEMGVRKKREGCFKKVETFSPGDIVCHYIYGTRKIRKITSDGKLMFEGLNGNFGPFKWKKVQPE